MLEPAAQIRDGRYRIVRALGEGAHATTYEAVDAQEGRLVAVKRFVVRGARSWKEVELAEREAHVLRSLDHPLVPRFIEHFEEDGALYLVTELVEGDSLQARALAGHRLDEAEVVGLIRDLADATGYLHRRSPAVIHRDIKPGNVIRRSDGRYCLVDFGAVRAKLAPSGGSTVVGTFGFMAPEQFQGRAMPQSDVYAIGATALSLLTGSQPEDLPHKGLRIDVASALRGGSDPALVDALTAMLDPDPDTRPASLEQVVARLTRGPPSARPAAARAPARGAASAPSDAGSRAAPPAEIRPPPAVAHVVAQIASVAVFLTVVLAVPLLLATLSILFGPRLRRAAATVREAGHRALRRIERARDEALGVSLPERAGGRRRSRHAAQETSTERELRTRVVGETRVETEPEAATVEAAEAEAEAFDHARQILEESRPRSSERRGRAEDVRGSSKRR